MYISNPWDLGGPARFPALAVRISQSGYLAINKQKTVGARTAMTYSAAQAQGATGRTSCDVFIPFANIEKQNERERERKRGKPLTSYLYLIGRRTYMTDLKHCIRRHVET